MRRIRKCDFAGLLEVFDQENVKKDKDCERDHGAIDKWPRERFREANDRFKGEWYEYEFDQADLARVRVHYNHDFDIPPQGMMLRDALNLPKFKKWVLDGKAEQRPLNTHLWLASSWYDNGGPEYKDMIDHNGCFILLDGIHRSLAWAHLGLPGVLVFMAGSPEEE